MTFDEWWESTIFSASQMGKAQARAAYESATLAERKRCAVVAWSHYMDTCKKNGIAPAICEEWLCAEAIRKG